MDYLAIGVIILFIIILLWLSPMEKFKVGNPLGYYHKTKSENLVNRSDWALMSRGLNVNNTGGYSSVVDKLNEMEKANSSDIYVGKTNI